MLKTLIFASALSLFVAGNAAAAAVPWSATVNVRGFDYDVALIEGEAHAVHAQLVLTPWWGDEFDAMLAVHQLRDALPIGTAFAYQGDSGQVSAFV
jgi:hypothetical protein